MAEQAAVCFLVLCSYLLHQHLPLSYGIMEFKALYYGAGNQILTSVLTFQWYAGVMLECNNAWTIQVEGISCDFI